jgi:phosphopantothenoylcysteine decarboxylase/phosphopantothenate--cysteine ligase
LLKKYLPLADICFHAAAVSDYMIKHPLSGKSSSEKPLPLELTPRTKILDTIKLINQRIFLVAFKAEWNVPRKKLASLALQRLKKSGADMIVANDVSRLGMGFGSEENEVEIINLKGRVSHVPRAPKTVIANCIVDHLITELGLRSGSRSESVSVPASG